MSVKAGRRRLYDRMASGSLKPCGYAMGELYGKILHHCFDRARRARRRQRKNA